MKNFILFLLVTLFVCNCDNRKELTKHTWIIVGGTYQKNPIQFHSTDVLKFVDHDGQEILYLNFSEDGTTTLPGINSPDISAKWTIVESKIHFSIDSSWFYINYREPVDLSFLEAGEVDTSAIEGNTKADPTSITTSGIGENTKEDSGSITFTIAKSHFTMAELQRTMEIYDHAFAFRFSRDSLILESKNAKILAIRDRTIEKMMEKFRY
jgi:hypothetical protein